MREFLDVAAEMTAHGQTLDDLHMQIARGEKIVSFIASRLFLCLIHIKQDNVVTKYKDGLQDRLEEYAGKTARQKYAKNPKYHEFRSSIWVCQKTNYFLFKLIRTF